MICNCSAITVYAVTVRFRFVRCSPNLVGGVHERPVLKNPYPFKRAIHESPLPIDPTSGTLYSPPPRGSVFTKNLSLIVFLVFELLPLGGGARGQGEWVGRCGTEPPHIKKIFFSRLTKPKKRGILNTLRKLNILRIRYFFSYENIIPFFCNTIFEFVKNANSIK